MNYLENLFRNIAAIVCGLLFMVGIMFWGLVFPIMFFFLPLEYLPGSVHYLIWAVVTATLAMYLEKH